jgi:hypothetical protein
MNEFVLLNFVYRDFEKTEKSIEEYRNEISMHIQEKDKLEKNIPASIVIGPYYIFAQKLREALSNKRKLLIEALLASQTRKARTRTEEVRNRSMKKLLNLLLCL